MNRIKTWALCNVAVLGLSLTTTLIGAALGGIDGAAVGGQAVWLLVPVQLLLLRIKDGKVRAALDERERGILGKAMLAALIALLTAMLVAGAIGAASGGRGAGLAFGFLLVGAPYVTMLAASVRAYLLVREPAL